MTWNPDWSRQYTQVYNIPQPQVSFGNVGMTPGVTIPETQMPPTGMPMPQPDIGVTPPTTAEQAPVAPVADDPYADPIPDFQPGFRLRNPKPQVPAQDPVSPPQNEVPVVQQPPAPVYTPPATPTPPPAAPPVVTAPPTTPPIVNPIVIGGGNTTTEASATGGDIINAIDRGNMVTMPGLDGPVNGQSGLGDGSSIGDPYGAEVPEIRTIDMTAAGDELVRPEDQEIGGIKINRYFDSKMK